MSQQPLVRAVFLLGAAAVAWLPRGAPVDMAGFAAAGRHLLAGQWSAVYADPWNQAGPIQLVFSALLLPGGRIAPPPPLVALANLALMGLVLVATRRRDVRVELGAAAFALAWLALPTYWSGHPVEALIPLLWLAALRCARRGATLRAAALFAATVAIAPWAILAVPALLAVCRPVVAVRTGMLAVCGAVACYLPFVASGTFRMFGHAWPVQHTTLVHLLDPGASTSGWVLRLVQASIVVAACAVTAWTARSNACAAQAALLVAVLGRIATDPLGMDYYWAPAAVLVIALWVALNATKDRTSLALIAALGYVVTAAPSIGWAYVSAPAALVLVVAIALRDVSPGRTVPSRRADARDPLALTAPPGGAGYC